MLPEPSSNQLSSLVVLPADISVSYTHLEKYCPGLEQYNFADESLYDTLIRTYKLNLKRIDETITITTLTDEESHYLNAEENEIGFCIKSTTYDEEKIVEYCITINRADRYMMVSTLGSGES